VREESATVRDGFWGEAWHRPPSVAKATATDCLLTAGLKPRPFKTK
jgi:hypothetical protein